jgi:PLP dependent protein
METIKENIHAIREEIRSISQGREIIMVAATKSQTREDILKAIDAGIKDVGENYVQEAEKKLKGLDVRKHFIGHLQTNKIRKAVEIFDTIQTVDSYLLAEKISKAAQFSNKKINIMIEVNISGDKNRYGVQPEKISSLHEQIKDLPNITVTGLMAMAPYVEAEMTRPYFKRMKGLQSTLGLPNLSCGMSNDYRIAIQEGSNIIRLGTSIFGPREPQLRQ